MAQGLPSSLDAAYEEAESTTFTIPKEVEDQLKKQAQETAKRNKASEQALELSPIPQDMGGASAGTGKVPYLSAFTQAAQKYNVPINVLIGLAEQESRFKPTALGTQTQWGRAKGLMQYLDSTAAGMGINPYDPVQSIDAAARQLRQRLDKGYSMIDATREHFAGPDRKKWGTKTHNYGIEVMQRAQKYQNIGAPVPSAQPEAPQQPQRSANPDPSRYRPLSADEVKRIEQAKKEGKSEIVLQIGMKPIKIGNQNADPLVTDKNKDANFFTDTGNLLLSGVNKLGESARELSHRIPITKPAAMLLDKIDEYMIGKTSEQIFAEADKHYASKMSAPTAKARQKLWVIEPGDKLDDGTTAKGWNIGPAWKDPRAYYAGIVESVPELAVSMGGSLSLARGAFNTAIKSGATREAASKAAAKTATLAGSFIEGGLGGASSAVEVRKKINELPDNVLQQSDVIRELMNGGLTLQQAKKEVAERSATKAFVLAGVGTGVFGGLGDRAIAKIITEGSSSRIKSALSGAVAEGVFEEMPQSAASQVAQNYAVQDADPNQRLMQGVANQAAGGLAVGAAMGGGIGGATHRAPQAQQAEQGEQVQEPTAQPALTEEQLQIEQGTAPERKIGAIERAVNDGRELDAAISAEIEAVTGQDNIEQLINQPNATPTDEGTSTATSEQWLGAPGTEVQVSPKEDPSSVYTVRVEGYQNGEVFARDVDGTPIQFGQNDIVSANPVNVPEVSENADVPAPETPAQQPQAQEQPKVETPAQPETVTENVKIESTEIPTLTDFGVTPAETKAATQADANLSGFEENTPQAAPDTPRAEPVEIESPEKTLAKMDEAELRARIKYLADQAKASGGWNKRLMEERRKVEAQINKNKEQKIDDKPYFKWEGMTPAERMAAAEKAGIDADTARDISSKAWGAIDKSITDQLTAKRVPKSKAAPKAPKVEQPKAKQEKADFADAVPEKKESSQPINEVADFERLIIDAHVNNPPMKARIIQDAVKAGRPRHQVLADVNRIISDYKAGKVPAATAPQATNIEGKDLGDGWSEFSKDSGSLGIPRSDMPQIKAEHRGAMVNFMNARDIAHKEETVPASSLKPTQAEFSKDRVKKASEREGGDRSILVSKDDHVLDGHHQWMAAREKGEDVKIIRLDAPITDLVDAAHEFPSSTMDDSQPAQTVAETETPKADLTIDEQIKAINDQLNADPRPKLLERARLRKERDALIELRDGKKEEPAPKPTLTKEEREERAAQREMESIISAYDRLYGNASISDLEASLERLNKQIQKLHNASLGEVTNGKRSTQKAVAAGGRDRMLKERHDLEKYIKYRKSIAQDVAETETPKAKRKQTPKQSKNALNLVIGDKVTIPETTNPQGGVTPAQTFEVTGLNGDDVSLTASNGSRDLQSAKFLKQRYGSSLVVEKADTGTRLSQSDIEPTGTTVTQVRESLVNRFGDKTIAKLERDSTLTILDSYDIAGVEGFAKDGKVTLIANELNPQTIIPTFLHELGGHVGFQGVMKPQAHANLMNQFDKLVAAKDPIALEAKRLAERESDANVQRDEYLPYLVTVAARTQQVRPGVRNLLSRIVSAVKAWAFDRLGVNLPLNANDIAALAERMVDRVSYQQKYAPREVRFSYAGERARAADIDALNRAKEMKARDLSEGTIRHATGWFTGLDGKWRFELDDADSKVKNLDNLDGASLESVFEHPTLFKNYPILQTIQMKELSRNDNLEGYFHPGRRIIAINERHLDNPRYVRQVIMHEIQHAIQEVENFAEGGQSSEKFAESVKTNLQALKQTKMWEREELLNEKADVYQERDRLRHDLRQLSMFETMRKLREYANMDKPSSQLRHVRNHFGMISHLDYETTSGLIPSTQEQRYALRELGRDWYAVGKRTSKQFNPRLKDVTWRAADLIQEFIEPEMLKQFKNEDSLKNLRGRMERRINKLYTEITPTEKRKTEIDQFGKKVDMLMNASPTTIYMALAGEIEARDVEQRLDMTDAQRLTTQPYFSQRDYTDRAVVVHGNRLQAMKESVDQTNTPEFKEWFGDSKVVDASGKPLVMYHGGHFLASEFESFRLDLTDPDNNLGAGFYFTSNRSDAEGYDYNQEYGDPQVLDVYLSIQNPYYIGKTPKPDGITIEEGEDFRLAVEKAGYDGIIDGTVDSKFSDEGYTPDAMHAVAFRPEQIKSASSNTGAFDPTNANIRFSRADDDLGTVSQAEYDSKLNQWWKEVKWLPSDKLTNSMRGWGLGLVPLRPMLKEIAKDIPAAQTYLRVKDKMDALRNEWHGKVDAVAQDWLKYRIKNREENRTLMDIMHESTLAQVDPSKPFESIVTIREKEAFEHGNLTDKKRNEILEKLDKDEVRFKDYERIKADYEALSPAAKGIYAQVRDAYGDMADAFDKTLLDNMEKAINVRIRKAEREYKREMERIKDEGMEGTERDNAVADAERALKNAKTKIAWNRKARLTQLRQQFETQRLAGPYFPLARFGDLFVTVRDAKTGEIVSFSRFENAQDQRRFADEMEKDKNHKVERGALANAAATRKAVDPNFVADVEDILSDLPNAEQIKDEVWQRYLESLPDMSIRKSRIHRKGRAGYISDAVRAFGHHLFHGSHQLARMTYSMDLEDALDQARDEARETKDPTRSGLVVNEIEKRHQFVMNPTGGQLATWASSFAFVWYLAGSPKAALMNLFQTPIMGIPILAAYDGQNVNSIVRAGNQLTRALVDFTQGKGYAERSSRLTAEERDAMEKGYETGIIEKTQGHELAGVAESGVEYNAVRERVMKVISWGFHHTERLNREVTFLAAYRIARNKGVPHEQAISDAGDLVWKTHFDYSNTSRPRLMHTDTMKILLVFRNFQLNMLFRLFRDVHQAMHGDSKEARREALTQLAGITGMMMLNAGITGTWLFGIAMLMAGLFMDDGEDPEEELKKGMVNILGPNLAGLALYGVPGHTTGTALSESIGMPDLWFRSPDSEKEGEEAMNFWVSQLLGAVPAIAAQMFRGVSYIKKGEEYRGIETMLPKMLKDPMKAYRYATEGAKNMKGDTVADVRWPDVVKQATGFTPARISEQYKINNLNYNKQQLILKSRKQLMDDYYKATQANDEKKVDEVLSKIEKHNEKNPDQPITAKGLIQSMKNRQKGSENAVGGMRYNNKLRERILEDQAPSIYK